MFLKALLQRVAEASVTVDGVTTGKIHKGLVVFLGVAADDNKKETDYLVEKIINLRIFDDTEGKFNFSCLQIKGELLVVSQFTLCADTIKGRRPSFILAAPPVKALELYNYFIECIKKSNLAVQTGIFGAHMLVEIHNDGPVTIMLDSKGKYPLINSAS
jgi:D-aminoacyl-tRNA deacylase